MTRWFWNLVGNRKAWLVMCAVFVAACSYHAPLNRTSSKKSSEILSEDPQWNPKLLALADALEAKRKEFHIPGMALAVVHNDRILFARGFGFADLENKVPATQETLFAIGSSSKAFTATLIGMLVDEGKMQWDEPVTTYLPYFQLKPESEKENDVVTIRDLLSHRSGFTRMGTLWAGGGVSRQEILKTATNAKPWESFRSGFFYSNVMYLAAGEASAAVSGMSWDNLLQTKLLDPLAMRSTNSTYAKAQADPRLSAGYTWNTETKTFDRQPMRNIDAIAPAGSINSNVLDMAQWLRFQLAKGMVAGKQLVSPEQLMETRSPMIDIAGPEIQYGMGWMLQTWYSQPLVHHGGNIDGFGAMVAFAPESDLGFVLLTNTTANPLQQLSLTMVMDHLLGEQTSPEDQVASGDEKENFELYTGNYVADFGPFENTFLKVLVQNGKLAVDVPGQTIYELKPADAEGKRYFELTNTIAVSFDKNDKGKIFQMRLHQAGFDFELPREGMPIEPEIDPLELTKFLGSYLSEKHNLTAKVFMKNHRLAIKMDERLDFELHLPDAEGRRRFRIRDKSYVVFNTADDGSVTSMSRYRDDELKEVMKRVESDRLPKIDEIHQLRQNEKRNQAWEAMESWRLSGTISFIHSGVSGEVVFEAKGTDYHKTHLDLGKFGYSNTVYTPQGAITESSFGPLEKHEGKYLDQVRKTHLNLAVFDWGKFYEKEEVLGLETLDSKKVYVIRLSGGEALPTTCYVDVETGDVLKQDARILHPVAGEIATTYLYSDFREVEGVRIPFVIQASNVQMGEIRQEIQKVETNLNLQPSYFQ